MLINFTQGKTLLKPKLNYHYLRLNLNWTLIKLIMVELPYTKPIMVKLMITKLIELTIAKPILIKLILARLTIVQLIFV